MFYSIIFSASFVNLCIYRNSWWNRCRIFSTIWPVSYTHLDVYKRQTEYLLGSSGTYVVEAHEKGGAKAAKDIEELVSEVTGMFAGGELSEDRCV